MLGNIAKLLLLMAALQPVAFCSRVWHYMVAGDASLQVQSAASQPSIDQTPKSDSLTLRRRQSFNYGDNRMGPLLPSEAGWAPLGRPPGAPLAEQALPVKGPSTPASPAAKATPAGTQHRAVGGPPSLGAAAKKPQPAREPGLKTSAVHRKAVSDSVRRPSDKAQMSPPVKSPDGESLQRPAVAGKSTQASKPSGAQSLRRAAVVGESVRVKRQGSSLAELVDKYKHDSAARKQSHDAVTHERISSLAAGLQHAASGNLTATSARASSTVHKQAADIVPAVISGSSSRSPMQSKAAVASQHPTAKPAQRVSLRTDRDKTVKAIAKPKLHATQGASVSVSAIHEDNRSSSDADNA